MSARRAGSEGAASLRPGRVSRPGQDKAGEALSAAGVMSFEHRCRSADCRDPRSLRSRIAWNVRRRAGGDPAARRRTERSRRIDFERHETSDRCPVSAPRTPASSHVGVTPVARRRGKQTAVGRISGGHWIPCVHRAEGWSPRRRRCQPSPVTNGRSDAKAGIRDRVSCGPVVRSVDDHVVLRRASASAFCAVMRRSWRSTTNMWIEAT